MRIARSTILHALVVVIITLLYLPVSYADVPLHVSVLPSEQKSGIEQGYEFGPYLSYLEDEKGSYSLAQVMQMWQENDQRIQPHYDDVLSLGLSESIYWLFIHLEFEGLAQGENSQWFLELANPLIKSSDLYILHEDKTLAHQIVGDGINVDQRANHRNFIFDVSNYGYSKVDLILRVDSHALISLPLTLWKAEALAKNNRALEYWLGFYFGLMAVMALYNLAIYFVIRDRSYLYYVGYIVSAILFFLVLSGSGRQYMLGDVSYWNERLPLIAAISGIGFILKFASAFVHLKKHSHLFNYFVNVLIVLLVILATITLYYPFDVLIPFVICMPFTAFFLLYIAVYSKRKGSHEATILLASLSFLIVSVFIFLSSMFGFFPSSLMGDVSIYFGSAIQVLLLSLGLANQINIERRKRYEALIRENQAVQNMRLLEERSLEKAMQDPLTLLPNRLALEQCGKNILQFKEGKRGSLVLAFIYLEAYQEINHTLGFRSSDLLLEKVANRLNRIAGEFSDCIPIPVSGVNRHFVAKLDGASFVLLFRLNQEKQKYLDAIEHILALLNRPVPVHDMMLEVNARAGLSFSPEHSTHIFTLVRFAQAAVEANEEKSKHVTIYSSVVSQQAARKLKLINDLRGAIQNDALFIVFQPQLDIREHKVVSLEALLRWQHPEFGEVGPSEFVALAEKAGLINEMTDWVITHALDNLQWLLEKGLKLRLAINISAKNLSQEDFSSNLMRNLADRHLDPSILTLELTETSLMQNPETAIGVLRGLHESGVHIAIDDFGSGYSSLAYIKQLPLSELKIDKSFVSQIDSVHSDRVITKSTIILAHEMGARVCAEGVESASCLKILSQFECDLAQGFHIAKPLTRENLLIWIDESQFMA